MKSSSKNVLQDKPSCWEGYYKKFLKVLPSVSQSYSPRDIFCDVCRIFCLSLRGAVTMSQIEKDSIEKEYQTYVGKYGKDGMQKIAILFSYVVEALELRRQDFLGHVYEELNATRKDFSQYLTPNCVARMMSMMCLNGDKPIPGKIVRMNDCSGGAGALLIEGAESFINNGGRQCDIILYGEDLDPVACCIMYIQFSLLGYPAIVTRQDTLAMNVFEGPWYTLGYFAHCIPMRIIGVNEENIEACEEKNVPIEIGANDSEKDNVGNTIEDINIRSIVQQEFEF